MRDGKGEIGGWETTVEVVQYKSRQELMKAYTKAAREEGPIYSYG